jgi:voltage-gated sodium channel
MVTKPMAWIFFVIYILISTFAVLNLFIAVVVNAMQENFAADSKKEQAKHEKHQQDILKSIDRRLQRLEKKLLK